MTSLYRSPPTARPFSAKFTRAWSVLFAVILLSVAINAKNAARNWPELTIFHRLLGFGLWLVLPVVAVCVLWRGCAVGRSILACLFGLRSIIGMLALGIYFPLAARDPLCLVSELRGDVLETMFYLSATAWLVCSPVTRIMHQRCTGGP